MRNFYELEKLPQSRLIIGYSEKRAKKDKYNREIQNWRLPVKCGKNEIPLEFLFVCEAMSEISSILNPIFTAINSKSVGNKNK